MWCLYFNGYSYQAAKTSAFTALYKGAIPRYRSQGMFQTKRGVFYS